MTVPIFGRKVGHAPGRFSETLLTILQRSKTGRVLWPLICIATTSGTPARPMFLTAVRLKSCKSLSARSIVYKSDPQGVRQYGLIAEEVAEVYPELVVWGAKGEAESVQYHELIPLLLNEVQRQRQEMVELKAQNEEQRAQNAALAARLQRLEEGMVHADTLATR
jgi:hypothetical protein